MFRNNAFMRGSTGFLKYWNYFFFNYLSQNFNPYLFFFKLLKGKNQKLKNYITYTLAKNEVPDMYIEEISFQK